MKKTKMENLKQKLPELRISTALNNKIERAIDKLNLKFEKLGILLTQAEFRRLALTLYSTEVLDDKISLLE